MCAKFKGGCVTKTPPTESWGERVTGDIKSTEVQERGEGSVRLGWAARADSELASYEEEKGATEAMYRRL